MNEVCRWITLQVEQLVYYSVMTDAEFREIFWSHVIYGGKQQ